MTFWNMPSKAQIERKRIYKTANAVGGAFLLGFGISNLLQFWIMGVLRDYTILSDSCVQWLVQIFLSTLIFTLPFIILTVPMNVRVSTACQLGRGEKGTVLPVILVGTGISMLGNILATMFTSFLEKIGFSGPTTSLPTDSSDGWLVSLLVILGGALLPAFIEEFALRGIALGALKKFGNGFAIIVTALLFGVMHGNIEQIPFAFMLGLYLGFAVVRTGTMWTAIAIHLINNFVAFLMELLSGVLSVQEQGIATYGYFMLTVLLTALGLLLAAGRREVFHLPPDEKTELPLGEKISTALLTPCVIIFGLYVVFELALNQILSMVAV